MRLAAYSIRLILGCVGVDQYTPLEDIGDWGTGPGVSFIFAETAQRIKQSQQINQTMRERHRKLMHKAEWRKTVFESESE